MEQFVLFKPVHRASRPLQRIALQQLFSPVMIASSVGAAMRRRVNLKIAVDMRPNASNLFLSLTLDFPAAPQGTQTA
jgi:hypothetical protein